MIDAALIATTMMLGFGVVIGAVIGFYWVCWRFQQHPWILSGLMGALVWVALFLTMWATGEKFWRP